MSLNTPPHPPSLPPPTSQQLVEPTCPPRLLCLPLPLTRKTWPKAPDLPRDLWRIDRLRSRHRGVFLKQDWGVYTLHGGHRCFWPSGEQEQATTHTVCPLPSPSTTYSFTLARTQSRFCTLRRLGNDSSRDLPPRQQVYSGRPSRTPRNPLSYRQGLGHLHKRPPFSLQFLSEHVYKETKLVLLAINEGPLHAAC